VSRRGGTTIDFDEGSVRFMPIAGRGEGVSAIELAGGVSCDVELAGCRLVIRQR